MATFQLLKALYDFSSFEDAKSKGKGTQWIIMWIIKFLAVQILMFIFILPVKGIWVWTGSKNSGLIRFGKFLLFTLMYYCVVITLLTLPFQGVSR